MAKAEEEEEEQEEEDVATCEDCGKKLTDDDNEGTGWCCEGCDKEPLCDDCCVSLGDDGEDNTTLVVCKKCIDKAYPRKETIVEKIVEKVKLVDGKEVADFDFETNTEFD